MPSSIATGPASRPDGLKGLVLADPSVIEEGFRVLDIDLLAGTAGTIDVLGLDGAGALTILAVAEDGPDATLARLLDLYAWASDQRDLLSRLYAPNGLVAGSPIRCLLLAPSFTHAFLRRLSLVGVEVTPYLARQVRLRGQSAVLVEPAAPIFGLEEAAERARAAERRGATGVGVAIAGSASRGAIAREVVLAGSAPLEEAPPGGAPQVEIPLEVVSEAASLEAPPLDDDPGDGRGWPAEAGPDRRRSMPPDLADLVLPGSAGFQPEKIEEIDPAGFFESLTAEELEEFRRFDRQRRERDRSAT